MPKPPKTAKKSAPHVIACVNLKGGVGKTALAVNFAAFCGYKGKKVLLIDLDPQTNATFSCISTKKWETHAQKRGTVADLLGAKKHNSADGKQKTTDTVIIKDVFQNVDLIPSHLDLFLYDLDMSGAVAWEFRLKQAVGPILGDYDLVVCDCPPNLTLPTQNALAISTHYVVPVSPDFLSGLGVALLLSRVGELGRLLQTELTACGIVISRYGRPAEHREQTAAAIRQQFPDMVLETVINERVAVSKSAAKQKSIFDSSDTAAISEFRKASLEILKRIGVEL